MTMRVELMRPDDPGWAVALSLMRHDVYHLPSYVEFAAEWQEPGDAYAFLAEEDGRRLLIPLIVRPIPPEVAGTGEAIVDAVSPRGFPGPLPGFDAGRAGDAFARRAIATFVATMRDTGVVSAYLLTHPLFDLPLDVFAEAGQLIRAGTTVSIDLALSDDELWRQTRANHRRSINKGRRAGYSVRIDESWERFDEFVDLHGQTMDRLEAATFWRHSRDYFVHLRAALAGRIFLCLVEREGSLAAAAILTEVDGIALYLTSGTAEAHLAWSPIKLVIDFARRWAKDRGNRVLHLGGSPRGADNLIHFKLGFSPLAHPVYSWRVVTDQEAYRRMSLGRAGHTTAATEVTDADEFFPAYRRPVALAESA
jgi:hypothetical protein